MAMSPFSFKSKMPFAMGINLAHNRLQKFFKNVL
jgi:hypothetical protein